MLDKIKYRLKVLRALAPFSFGVRRFLPINLLVGLAVMVLGFVQPLFYKMFIDDVILKNKLDMMPLVAFGYLAVFGTNLLLSYVKNYSTNRLVNRVTFQVKMKIWHGFFSRDFSDYDNQSVGDMKMRLDDDTECIASFAGAQTTDYVIAYITFLVSAGLLFFVNRSLAMFSCLAIPLTFWLDWVVAKHEAVVINDTRENNQKMSSWLHASVRGWREVKALNLQKHEERQFTRFIHRYAILFGTWINFWVARVLIIPKIKDEFLMQFSLYFLGGLLIINGHLEIGALLVFMQYYTILSNAVKTVSGMEAELSVSSPQFDRMLDELNKAAVKKAAAFFPDRTTKLNSRTFHLLIRVGTHLFCTM